MDNTLILVHENINHTMATWRRTAVFLWHRETTTEGLRMAGEAVKRARQGSSQGVGALAFIGEHSTTVTSEQRLELNRILASEGCASICCVPEGTKLRSSVVRSQATDMSLKARDQFAIVVVGNMLEAASWLQQRHPDAGGPYAQSLVQAITATMTRVRGDAFVA